MAEPAQPPASWAELMSRLEALLGRLGGPHEDEEAPFLGAVGLLPDSQQWRTDVHAALAAAATEPSPAEREALARCGVLCCMCFQTHVGCT